MKPTRILPKALAYLTKNPTTLSFYSQQVTSILPIIKKQNKQKPTMGPKDSMNHKTILRDKNILAALKILNTHFYLNGLIIHRLSRNSNYTVHIKQHNRFQYGFLITLAQPVQIVHPVLSNLHLLF